MISTTANSFAVSAARSAHLEDEITEHPEGFRVLTGDRPTGALHLGHYFGTLANRVRLQHAGVEVFVVIADYQVITDRDRIGDLSSNVRELRLDYLAAGIGAGALKAVVVEAVNEYFRPLRKRRIELSTDPGLLDAVLTRGNARANEIANDTLDQVCQVMDMTY